MSNSSNYTDVVLFSLADSIKIKNLIMVSISIVDYMGKIKDGVAVVLTINIDDTIYQMIFWFNKECQYVLSTDEELLKMLNIKTIYEYEHLEDLLKKIFTALPPVVDLFKQFEV